MQWALLIDVNLTSSSLMVAFSKDAKIWLRGHGRAHLQVAGFIEGIERVARLPKIVGFDVAIAADVTDLDKVVFC